MFGTYRQYTAVPELDDENATEIKTNTKMKVKQLVKQYQSRDTVLVLSLTANLLLFIYFLGNVLHRAVGSRDLDLFPHQLYSPAQGAIRYQPRTFESGFHGSQYTGKPTLETDTRWRELYRVGNSRISKIEAAQLPNKTITAVAGEEDYLVVISVFHDLHCLDRLRQSMWYFYDDGWNSTHNPFTMQRPTTYEPDGLNGIVHLDHCINILRQSLQCFSDVSTYVFQWDEDSQEVKAHADVVHTCRNFDAVRDWALSRTYTGTWGREGYRDEQGHCRFGESGTCDRYWL